MSVSDALRQDECWFYYLVVDSSPKEIDYWILHNQAFYELHWLIKSDIDLDQRDDAGLFLKGIPSCSVVEERILLSALSVTPFHFLPAVTSS